LLKLEEQATTPPVIVNIGGSHPVSIKELAETVIRISGKDMKIMYDLSKPVGPFSRTSDNTKAKNLLGWETKTSLEDGLRRTYAWEEKRLSVQDI
jgi:GDP-D-mannose 3',5'-epimerase